MFENAARSGRFGRRLWSPLEASTAPARSPPITLAPIEAAPNRSRSRRAGRHGRVLVESWRRSCPFISHLPVPPEPTAPHAVARFLQPLPQVEQVVLQDESARAGLLRWRTERHVWIRGDADDHSLWMETYNLTRCPDAVARVLAGTHHDH